MNLGIYIAGGGKDAGKTTLSLGLVSYFKDRMPGGAAFIKPIGQKTVTQEGATVGQDSYFLDHALRLGLSLEKTAPFAASTGAALKYINTGEPGDLPARIRKAYKYLAGRHDIVIVEGTGHPGVGSVFDLSNAQTAACLDVPVILILDGGIGSTIDRFSMCEALFKLENVRILGVIVNRILPKKMEKVKEALTPWFERKGIPIFGFIPYDDILSIPSIDVIGKELDAEVVSLYGVDPDHPISGFVTGFGSVDEVMKNIEDNPFCALVLSSGRLDVLNALLARKLSGLLEHKPGALVLCGRKEIEPWIHKACEKLGLPLFFSRTTADKAVQRLFKRVFKVEPDEAVKIEEMVRLIREHVDIEAILQQLQSPAMRGRKQKKGILSGIIATPVRLLRKIFSKREKPLEETETGAAVEEEN